MEVIGRRYNFVLDRSRHSVIAVVSPVKSSECTSSKATAAVAWVLAAQVVDHLGLKEPVLLAIAGRTFLVTQLGLRLGGESRPDCG